jgi:hypothetical protein
MAIVGAGTYHLAAKPKAEAMSEAYGRQRVETGEIRVKVGEDGAPKTVKIDADELPVFKEKLEKAKGNKEKVEEVLRESPSIKRQVAEEDLGRVTFVEKPTTTVLGMRVPFTSKTKGLEIKPEVIEGTDRLGNSLDERLFRWQQRSVERLSDLRFKNPITEYYRKKYNIPESGSARTSESSSVRSEASASETPRAEASVETPRSEASATEAPRAEAPATETPVVETPRTEEPSARRAEEPKTEEPKAEEPKVEEAPAIEMREKRREARKAKKGTDSNTNKIYSSREKVRKLLKSNSIPKENAEKLSEYLGNLKKGEHIDPDKVKECLKSLPFNKNGSKL